MNHDRDETAFDQAMRRLHAEALTRITPNTQARLRSARHAGARPAPARWGAGWVMAGGFAAVCALVIGLQLQLASPQAPPARPLATTAATAYDYDDAVAVLDENPDLYLWLASNDDALPPTSE